ncbi:hypothetical protein [Microscilla marina]|uniref:hypothetical protein n=1 Tax=Microscilla marina TaxID=1027 RepID=UPI0005D47AC1|nr:hypothetical protein [Microscilla marina]
MGAIAFEFVHIHASSDPLSTFVFSLVLSKAKMVLLPPVPLYQNSKVKEGRLRNTSICFTLMGV